MPEKAFKKYSLAFILHSLNFRYLDLFYFAYKNHCAIEEEEKKKYKENYLSILHQNTNLSINHASSDDNEQSNVSIFQGD